MRNLIACLVFALFLSLPNAITAAPPFTIDITVDDGDEQQQYFDFSDEKEVFDLISEDHLREKFSYKGIPKVDAVVDYLGVEMNFSFPEDSNELELEVPSLDIRKIFKGDDRDDSIKRLKIFLNRKVVATSNLLGSTIIASEGVQIYAEAPSNLFGNWFNKKIRPTREIKTYVLSGLEIYPSFRSGNQFWVKLKPQDQSSGSDEDSCWTAGGCWALVGRHSSESTESVFLWDEFAYQDQ